MLFISMLKPHHDFQDEVDEVLRVSYGEHVEDIFAEVACGSTFWDSNIIGAAKSYPGCSFAPDVPQYNICTVFPNSHDIC